MKPQPKYKTKKERTEATIQARELVAMARNKEINDIGPDNLNLAQMFNDASNICPHEGYYRADTLDAGDFEVWVCPDCGNNAYIHGVR